MSPAGFNFASVARSKKHNVQKDDSDYDGGKSEDSYDSASSDDSES